MTTTADSADGDSSSVLLPDRIRRPMFRYLFSSESDARLGQRVALYGPIALFAVLLLGLVFLRIEAEAELGLTMSYWLFIGVVQLLYLIPAAGLALVIGRRGVALGLLQGGGLIGFVNVLAWVIGYYFIGAR